MSGSDTRNSSSDDLKEVSETSSLIIRGILLKSIGPIEEKELNLRVFTAMLLAVSFGTVHINPSRSFQ